MANPFFDAAYYLAQNPDVEAAFGDDAAAAEAHYIANGADEGRKPAQWFDAAYYQSSNADLAGLAPNELFEHFANYGVNELRSPSEGLVLDAATFQAYAAANEDLVAAFGIEDVENLSNEDVAALANHFFAYGIHEGREGGPGMPADLTDLTEALAEYQDTVEARDDFLKEAAKNEKVAELLADDAELSVEEAIGNAFEALETELENAEFTEAQLAAFVVTAEANLAAAQARYNANASTELKNAVAVYRAETNKLVALKDVRDEANEVSAAAFDDFIKANPKKTFNYETLEELLAGSELVLKDTTDPDNELVLAEFVPFDGTDPEGGGRVVLTADGQAAGAGNLVSLINDALTASDAVNAQQLIRDAAKEEVNEIDEGQSLFTSVEDAEVALENAETAVADREALVESVKVAEDLVDQLELLDENVDDARDAIEDLGYHLVEFDDADAATGTAEDDVFVYNGAEEATIGLFGEEGNDVLFVGTEFTYNDDIDNGDSSVYEVFITQEGSDVVVWIEQTPFGSNANVPEFDTITLTGVSIDDIQFADGYVQLV